MIVVTSKILNPERLIALGDITIMSFLSFNFVASTKYH